MYADNRLDVLPHIQNQVASITAMLKGKEPISGVGLEMIKNNTLEPA